MHGCTHLSRFALVSRVFRGRYAKKYTGYCIIWEPNVHSSILGEIEPELFLRFFDHQIVYIKFVFSIQSVGHSAVTRPYQISMTPGETDGS